jgi:hypothetical protein
LIIRGFFPDLTAGQVDPQDPARISVRHVPLFALRIIIKFILFS